jgi:hypothetical protein
MEKSTGFGVCVRTEKETADLSTTLRSGRDDNFVAGRDSAFPGKVRGTADPSASLGMTKERATFLWKVVSDGRRFSSPRVGPQAHDHSDREGNIFLFVQASQHAAGIADGEDSGGKVAGDDAACADNRVLTDGDAGADNDAAA